MPGFSRKEQAILSQLVLGHRGDVRKMSEIIGSNQMMWFAILSLRLAALFCRARLPVTLPPFTRLRLEPGNKGFSLCISQSWLDEHPLVAGALEYESEQWQKINMPFTVVPQ